MKAWNGDRNGVKEVNRGKRGEHIQCFQQQIKKNKKPATGDTNVS